MAQRLEDRPYGSGTQPTGKDNFLRPYKNIYLFL